jgi:hypothetical protein
MPGHSVDDLARSFERHLRAGNKSPRTVEAYLEAANQLLRPCRLQRRDHGPIPNIVLALRSAVRQPSAGITPDRCIEIDPRAWPHGDPERRSIRPLRCSALLELPRSWTAWRTVLQG